MTRQRKIEEGGCVSSPPVDNILIELIETHFQLIEDTLGGGGNDLGPPYSQDLVYTLEARLIEIGAQKELSKARLENLNAVVDSKLEETILLVESSKVELDKINQETAEREDLLHPDKQDTLNYTLQILREKLSDLKDAHASLNIVDTAKMEDLMKMHQSLLSEDKALATRLAELSSKGTLPPNYAQAEAKLVERKDYLDALRHQITSLQNMSSDISSVFGDSKFR